MEHHQRKKRKHKSRSKETKVRQRSTSVDSSSSGEENYAPRSHRRRRSSSISVPRETKRSKGRVNRSTSDDLDFCLYSKLIEENTRLKDSYRTDALIIHLIGKLKPPEKMIVVKHIIALFPELTTERDSYIRNYSPRFQNVIRSQ